MTKHGTTSVKLLVMDRHFLYLPLYIAQFDGPSIGKRPWFGKIPPQYSIEVTPPERESDRKDKSVFDLLMDARLGSSDIMFAACDPTVLLGRQDQNAMMAAALITSSAFWAVNHDAGDVRLVSDLSSFDRILCYEPGTTSNLIARRIAKRDTGKLQVVKSTDEIPQLERLGESTLALSPEVLKIANLVYGPLRHGEKRAKIVFELSTSKEFSNVLTTVLFTRADVIEKHPDLVSGILAALQSALLAIHAGDPMVKAAAMNNYRDAFHLDEALAIAGSGNVFPETIHVRHDRWQRACEFYYISQALAEGREKNSLTKTEQRKTEELYNNAVQDKKLGSLVAEAITSGFREALDNGEALSVSSRKSRWMLWVTCGALVPAVFGSGILYAATDLPLRAKMATGISWIFALLAGWWFGELVGYRKRSLGYAAHWVSFVFSWWALHELAVPRVIPNAHFLRGIELGDGLAGGIVTVASAWVIGMGLYVRAQIRDPNQVGSKGLS
jgi:hypothetical protein